MTVANREPGDGHAGGAILLEFKRCDQIPMSINVQVITITMSKMCNIYCIERGIIIQTDTITQKEHSERKVKQKTTFFKSQLIQHIITDIVLYSLITSPHIIIIIIIIRAY